MPIYEFYSPKTNKVYSFFARSSRFANSTPKCPDNPHYPMEKKVSAFAVTRSKDADEGIDGDDLDDPKMAAAMAEMERELSGLDEENPDPRQMGQLMRKMADMTGEKLPASMEEMVRRLEAGEDPEKLEEEFGDLEDMDDFGDGSDGGSSLKDHLRRRMAPQKDPQLYELSDYLD